MKATEIPLKFTPGQPLEFLVYEQKVKGTFVSEDNDHGDITIKVTESFNLDHVGKQLPLNTIFLVTK